MVMSKILYAALALFLFTTSLLASQQNLRVGIAGQPPFINLESVPSGAAVDIWEKIAAENDWSFDYTRFDTIKNGLKAIADGSVDVLVGDTPINKENLAQVEFSQPFFHSGLQILIADNQRTVRARLANDVKDLLKLEIFWIILACIVVLSTTVYLFERKHNPDFPAGRREGLAEAFYYVVTLALTGKTAYKGFPGVLGRLVLIIWILLGIISVAYVTSSITSAMTVEKLSNAIENLRDLNNKTIAVISDSPAEDYIKKVGIDEYPAKDIQDAVRALLAKQADAVVADAAVLQSFDFNNPRLPLRVVGRIFQVENYGFAMPIGSPLRMPLNRQLVKMQESKETHTILAGYFGEANVQ
jgi:ABC-type amino acid transport substrate-binding protein